MRLFCAIELSSELRDRLVQVPAQVGARGFRLVDRAQLHLTMRFLGIVDDELFPLIGSALVSALAHTTPFNVHATGAGTFASRGEPRVLWAGLDDTAGRLASLAAALDGSLDAIIGARDRPFRPHVTLGRGKDGAHVDVAALAELGALGNVRVGELVVFESTPASTGTTHTPRARLQLGAAA